MKRFDIYWLGEIQEDGKEVYGFTVAECKSLNAARKIARMKKIDIHSHEIQESRIRSNIAGIL